MKRFGNLWPLVYDRQNVSLSVSDVIGTTLRKMHKRQAQQGKKFRFKPCDLEAMDIQEHFDEYVSFFQQALQNETYSFGEMTAAIVHEKKQRKIDYPVHLSDRIYHHCIVNVTGPLIINKLTADTYGSLKGRGLTQVAEKIRKILRSHPEWYFLQTDFRHYYENVDHDWAKAEIRRVFKDEHVIRMFDAIIDHHNPGLAIGVFPSAYIANLHLSDLDHRLKEVEKVPFVFRVMDDIVCIIPTKADAWRIYKVIEEYGKERFLEVKSSFRIAPVKYGIDFCGYVFYPTHTRLRKSIKKQMKRTIRRWKKADDVVFKRKLASHYGWCTHANCRHLVRTAFGDKYYIFAKNMEYNRLFETPYELWFGLTHEDRVSIRNLENKEIIIHEFEIRIIDEKEKIGILFSYPDDDQKMYYFLTSGGVMKDRLQKGAARMPGIATVGYNSKKHYYYIE